MILYCHLSVDIFLHLMSCLSFFQWLMKIFKRTELCFVEQSFNSWISFNHCTFNPKWFSILMNRNSCLCLRKNFFFFNQRNILMIIIVKIESSFIWSNFHQRIFFKWFSFGEKVIGNQILFPLKSKVLFS